MKVKIGQNWLVKLGESQVDYLITEFTKNYSVVFLGGSKIDYREFEPVEGDVVWTDQGRNFTEQLRLTIEQQNPLLE